MRHHLKTLRLPTMLSEFAKLSREEAETSGSALVLEARAAQGLEHLGLKVAHQHLDQVAQQAAAGQWSYTHFLGYLLDGELEERRRRSIELPLQFAKFPYRKRLED